MSDPTRWKDDDSSPPEVRDLLRQGQGAGRSRPLPPASKARSAARIDRMLALPAAAGLLLWMKGVAVAAGIAVVGVVAARQILAPAVPAVATSSIPSASATSRRTPPVRANAMAAPDAVSPATDGSAANSADVAPAPAPVALPSTTRVAPVPTASTDPLEQEAAMLDSARARLASDPRSALAVLDEHATAFPSGHLGLEREILAVEALRRLHRFSEARARGEALLQRAPGSIYEPRVRAILDSLPTP